jgi:acyl carrier protein
MSALRRLVAGGLSKSLASQLAASALVSARPSVASFVPAPRFSGLATSHYVPREEVELKVLEFLGNYPQIKKEALTPTAHFVHDLGLDSLSCTEVIVELELEFDTEFNDQDAAYLVTVNDVVDYLAHTPYIQGGGH